MLYVMLVALAIAAYKAYEYRNRHYMPPTPERLRTDLEFWFYGMQPGDLDATNGSITLAHESLWFGGLDAAIDSMIKHQKPTILTAQEILFDGKSLRSDAGPRMEAAVRKLRSAGVAHLVKYVYVADEPDGVGISNEDMLKAEYIAKAAFLQFDVPVKTMVTYSTKKTYPGISHIDIVGIDDYGQGSGILKSSLFKDFVSRLADQQQFYLVPGGANPWKQHPEAFVRYAHANPKCFGIMAFLWGERNDSGEVNEGIKTNGMASAYLEAGKAIVSLRPPTGGSGST
jgi:hypothetical protein